MGQKLTSKRFLYRLIQATFFIIGLGSIILALILTENFILRFSVDKIIYDSTLAKLVFLRMFLVFVGSLFLYLFAMFLKKKEILDNFIFRHESKLKNLILLLFVLIMFFLVFEVVLRIYLKSETSLYGFGPGSLKFNKNFVLLNNEGARDYNFNIEKDNRAYRIVAVGDSFVYGAGVKNVNDTFLKVLERIFNNESKNGKKFEFYNFAVPGAYTASEIDILNEKGLKYEPDLILIGYNLNDFINVDPDIKEYKSVIGVPFIGFWLRNYFYSYYFLESRFNKVLEIIKLKQNYESALLINLYSQKNKEYHSGKISDIAKIAEENNISVVFVIFPLIYNLNDYPLLPIDEFVKDSAKKENFYVVDLLLAYSKYPESQLVVNNYDSHPNELGHKLAAEETYKIMKENNLTMR